MKEKLSNVVACRLSDSELQELQEHLDRVEKCVGFPVRASQVVLGFIRKGLAADKSESFPAHSPLAGKMERRSRGSGKASNVIKLKQSA